MDNKDESIARDVIWKCRVMPFKMRDGKMNLPRFKTQNYRKELPPLVKEFFQEKLKDFTIENNQYKTFKVWVTVYAGNDGLGIRSDLDNHCKTILDAISDTKKIWSDDKHVDEIILKRKKTEKESYIDIEVSELGSRILDW